MAKPDQAMVEVVGKASGAMAKSYSAPSTDGAGDFMGYIPSVKLKRLISIMTAGSAMSPQESHYYQQSEILGLAYEDRLRFLADKYGGSNGDLRVFSGESSGQLPRHRTDSSTASRVTDRTSRTSRQSNTLRRIGAFRRPDLMRATPVSSVLRRFGGILAQSRGSEATYQLSRPVEAIDWFISHNWTTPHGEKYLAIAFFFYSHLALFVACVFMIAVMLLTAYGMLPMFSVEGSTTHGLYCTLSGPIVFVLTLMFTPEILAACCPLRAQPKVFLDKVCVNQVDPILKREGIECLGAFLRNSTGMLIVYTDLYLQKLWTVYEVASVLILNPDIRVQLVPTIRPKVLMCFMTVLSGIMIISHTVHFEVMVYIFGERRHLLHGFAIALCLPLTVVAMKAARCWNQVQEGIYSSCSQFHMRDAKCFCEDDRPLVQGNVADCLRELEVVGNDVGDDEALEVFDAMVQAELPQLIAAQLGLTGIRYDDIAVAVTPCLGWALDALGSSIHNRAANTYQIVFEASCNLIVALSVWPNIIALVMITAKYTSRSDTTPDRLTIVFADACMWVVGTVSVLMLRLLSGYTWATAAYLVAHALITLIAYRPTLGRRHKVRAGATRLCNSFFLSGEGSSSDFDRTDTLDIFTASDSVTGSEAPEEVVEDSEAYGQSCTTEEVLEYGEAYALSCTMPIRVMI